MPDWRTTRHAAEDALGTPRHYNQTQRAGQKGDVAMVFIATSELPTGRSETLLAQPSVAWRRASRSKRIDRPDRQADNSNQGILCYVDRIKPVSPAIPQTLPGSEG